MNKHSRLFRLLKKLKFILTYPRYYFRQRENIAKQVTFYSTFIQEDSLVYDVGANIGDKTAIFRKIGARVIAIEPQSYCIRKLIRRFRKDLKVEILHKGLGSEEGQIEINICVEAPTISTMSEKWQKTGRFSEKYNWERAETVSLTTLDALIDKFGIPDYCKIDVEGFELSVLRGLSSKIPLLSFEFTAEFLDDAESCLKHLQEIGSIATNVFMEPGTFIYSEYIQPDDLISRLRTDNRKDLTGDIFVRFINADK